MVQIEHLEFISISKGFINKPFEVTNAWVEYQIAKGSKVLFFVDSIEQPQILCWTKIKKVKFIGEVLEVHGPIYRENITTKQLYKFLNVFKDLSYKGVFLNPSTTYDVSLEVALRKALFKRPIGQSSTSLTIVVQTDEFNPDTNWKRNLKKANVNSFNININNILIIFI